MIPRPRRPRGALPDGLRRAVPALLGVAVLAAMSVIALQLGQRNLQIAEQDRLSNRIHLVDELSRGFASTQSGLELDPVIALAGFDPTATDGNRAALGRLQLDAVGDPPAAVALLDPGGRILADTDPGGDLDVAVLAPAWSAAARGERGISNAFRHRGVVVTAVLVPLGAPRPWAVLAVVRRADTSADQETFRRFGSLNGYPGGATVVDRAGVVVASWQPERIGGPGPPAAELTELRTGAVTAWTAPRAGRETTVIGIRLASGYAFVFEQASDDLYGDLRVAQGWRDRTLLGVLAATIAGLALLQTARERAARRGEGRRRALLANGQDLVLVTDGGGRLSFVSSAAEILLGHRPDDWHHRPLAQLCHPADAGRVAGLLAEPGAGPLLDVRLRDATGEHRWFDIEASDHRGHRDVGGILVTCHDAGPRRARQEELHRRATHDALTGLPNRAALDAHLHARAGDGRPGTPLAFLFVDLDRFKPVNDTLGHQAGDDVLAMIARRFEAAAGPEALVVRLGGDEFGVVLAGAGEAEATAVADRLRDAARSPIAVAGGTAAIDASIGIALVGPDHLAVPPELLVRSADQALYGAKRAGRGRWVLSRVDPPAATATATATGAVARPAAGGAGERRESPGAPGAGGDGGTGAHRSGPAGPPRPVPPPQRPRAAIPLLAAATIVVAIAALGQAQTVSARREAEAQLVGVRMDETVKGEEFYAGKFDPARVVTVISDLPWTLDGSAVDHAILSEFARYSTPRPESDVSVTLAAADGRLLAGVPAGTTGAVPPSSPVWRAALEGVAASEPAATRGDQLRSYVLFPIVRHGRVAAVIGVDTPAADGVAQTLVAQLGTLGSPEGGWSLVDHRGVAYASWRPELIGRRLADPAALATAGPGHALVSTDDGVVVIATPMTSLAEPEPSYLVYREPTASLFHDLRLGQLERDLSLVAVLLAAVAGMAVVNHRRVRALRASEVRLDALVQHAHDLVVVLDTGGRASFVSSAVTALLGWDAPELLGRPLIDLAHPDDAGALTTALAAVGPGPGEALTDVRLRRRDGGHRWFDIDVRDLRADRDVGGVLLACHEVGERRAFQDTLAHQASHDPLTGLPNRAAFAEALERRAHDADPAAFAVLFVDLDHFKGINDEHGHGTGDDVLRTVADRLRTSIRGIGAERGADLVCRLGGDEFAVLLAGGSEPVARAAAERILAALRRPVTTAGATVTLSATVGVALSHPDHEHPGAALRHADLAMYRAKAAGRDGYELHASVPR